MSDFYELHKKMLQKYGSESSANEGKKQKATQSRPETPRNAYVTSDGGKTDAYKDFMNLHKSIQKKYEKVKAGSESAPSTPVMKKAPVLSSNSQKTYPAYTPTRTRQEYESAISSGKQELSRLAEMFSKKQNTGSLLWNAIGKRDLAKQYGYESWKEAQDRYDALQREMYFLESGMEYDEIPTIPGFEQASKVDSSYKKDNTYAYINNIDGFRNRQYSGAMSGGGANKTYAGYDKMTDYEVGTYNAIYATEGKEAAEKYLEYLSYSLSERDAQEAKENAEYFARKAPVLSDVISTPMNLVGGVEGAVDVLGQKVAQGVTGQYKPTDFNRGTLASQAGSAIRGYRSEQLNDLSGTVQIDAEKNPVLSRFLNGKGVGDLYQLGMSMVDSGAAAGISAMTGTGWLGGALLGTSAGTQAMIEAANSGATDSQSIWTGITNGAFEMLFEKVSIDRLLSYDGKNIIKSILTQGMVEGSEEAATSVANTLADIYIMAADSEWSELVDQYMAEGDDLETARWKALRDKAVDIAYDFAAGSLTGGLMGGGASAVQNVTNRFEETATLRESAPDLVAESQELSGDTELGTRIQEQIEAGKKVSGRDLRTLVAQNEQAIATQTATQAEAMLTERGETGNVAEVAQVVGKMATGQRLTRQEMQIFRDSQNAADVLNEINEAEATTETSAQEATETAQEEQIPSPVEVEGESRNVAVEAPVAQESASVPAPVAEVVEPTETDVKAAQGATRYEDESRELEANSKQYGEQAEDYIRSFDAGQNVAEYDTAWKAGYELGMSQVPQAQAMESSDLAYLTPGQRVDAYEAGLKAAGVIAEQKEARVQGMTRNATGSRKRGIVRAYNGINTATLAQKFNDSQRKAYKILSTIADVTGIEIVLYESTPDTKGRFQNEQVQVGQGDAKYAQGIYIRSQPGRIFVDLNAGISHVSEVGDMANYTMLATFTHEFVHFCENWNPIRYNELRKAVFDAMAEHNINVEERIDQLMANSKGELSREDASREAVAEALVEILPDANFVEQLANEHKTLFRKLLERLKEFLQEIKDYFSGMRKSNEPTVAALKEEADGMARYMEHIVKLFDNVAVEAVNRMQASDRNSDAEKNGIQKHVRKARSEVDEESTIVNDNPEAHTPEEQAVIEAYKDAVDPELLAFIDEVRNEENKYKARLKTKKISDVTQRAVDDVKRILGVDVSGYSHVIDGSAIAHIEHRHGTNGHGDSSMRDENDMARIGYVLANYDHATIGLEKDGTQRFSEKWRNSDNTKAPTVVFSKKINGTYYVVEAVPNTKRHNMTVITAYINKKGVSSPELNMSKKSDPQPTSETLRAQETPINSIAKVREEVNTQFQRRPTNRLSDLEVLNAAADGLEGLSLTEAEENSLGVMRQKLARLAPISDQIEEHERLAEEYSERDPDESQKERNRAIVLKTKQTRELNSILAGANGPIMRRVLQKARSIVERQELTEYRASRKESELAKRYKARIEKDVNELIAWGMKPDTKNAMKHIPEGIKGPVMDFLEAIDFSSKRKLAGGEATQKDTALFAKLSALHNAFYGEGSALDEQYRRIVLSDALKAKMEEIQSTLQKSFSLLESGESAFNLMNRSELESLSSIVKQLKKFIQEYNVLYKNAAFQHVAEAGADSAEGLKKMSPIKNARATAWFDWGMTRPADVWERFGEGGKSIFRELQVAQGEEAFRAQEVIEYAAKTYQASEVKAWEKEVKTIKLSNGEDVKMTVAQIMSLYKLREREQAMSHIRGEGIRIAELQERQGKSPIKKAVIDQGHTITDDDLDTIVGELNDRQKAVADALQKYMQDKGSEWGNRVTLIRFGEKLFGEPKYFPIHVYREGMSASLDESVEAASLYALLNMGFTKQTKKDAQNQIVIYSIFDEFSVHMSNMALYSAYALPVVDAIKWLNYKDAEKKLNLRDELARVYGRKKSGGTNTGIGYAEDFILDMLKAINGTDQEKLGWLEKQSNQITSRYNRAQVAANISVAIQQPLSVLRAADIVSAGSISAGVIRKVSHFRQTVAEMEKHSGIAVWKKLGFYDVNISRGVSTMIKHDESLPDWLSEKGMVLAEFMDRWAWASMWEASKKEVETKKKLKQTDEGYWDAVNAQFDEIVFKTQVVDSPLTKPKTMRTKSAFVRPFTSFMMEPLTTVMIPSNIIYDYRVESATNGVAKTWGKYGKKFTKAMAIYTICETLNALIMAAFIDVPRDDDEYPTWWEKFTRSFLERWSSNMNPLNKIPVVSKAWKAILLYLKEKDKIDYDVYKDETAIESMFNDMATAYDTLRNKLSGKDTNYTTYSIIYNLAKGISGLTGIPASSAMREAVTAWNNTVGTLYPNMQLTTYNPDPKQEIREAYESGYLTDEEALEAMQEKKVSVPDSYLKTPEVAYKGYLRYWAYKSANPKDESVEDTWFIAYGAKGVDTAGIKLETYLDYRKKARDKKNERKTWTDEKQKEISEKDVLLDLIDSMNLTSKHKDALYAAEGWSPKTISEAPWH